jgi:SAM-dependent methyltransferase
MSTDMLDFRIFAIREPRHRTHNPLTEEQFACLGAALGLPAGASILDLGCGSGEMLCTWARDYGVTGTGIDIYPGFIASAVARAEELGVSGAVWFVASDAAGYVAGEPVDVAACVGATWIGGGVPGTLALLRQSLKPGGTLLVGEPFWRTVPTSPQVLAWSGAQSADDFLTLPALLASFSTQGYDVVEMVCATEESWDRYTASQWLNMRRWADANPGHELHDQVRRALATEPQHYAAGMRAHVGWGAFALAAR